MDAAEASAGGSLPGASQPTPTHVVRPRVERLFAVGDAVALRGDPDLRGHVLYAPLTLDHGKSLKDRLMFNYTKVPLPQLWDFLRTGEPPVGFSFVAFSHPSQGHALVHEDDLVLIDRPLRSGDVVRLGIDTLESGTVLSVTSKASLTGITKAPSSAGNDPTFVDTGPGLKESGKEAPSCNLHSIPLSELRDYIPFRKNDYVIVSQRLGIIEEVCFDYVVQLKSGKVIVIPYNADYELSEVFAIPAFLPVDTEVRIECKMWEPVSVKVGPNRTAHRLVSPEELVPGQYVLILPDGLEDAKWLSGSQSYDDLRPYGLFEGNVTVTTPSSYEVRWICANPFEVLGSRSPKTLITWFNSARFEKIARKVKPGKMSMDTDSGEAFNFDPQEFLNKRVVFKDFKSAIEKHEGLEEVPDVLGYDMNVFQILEIETQATVVWQNGTISNVDSKRLCHYPYPYSDTGFDVMPGSLVLDAEGLRKQKIKNVDAFLAEFLHRPLPNDCLLPSRVGVVQNYRLPGFVTQVRWFKGSKVAVYHNGSVLSFVSSFGELEEEKSTVSVFSLHQIPALMRKVGDFVLFSPPKMHKSVLADPLPETLTNFTDVGACHLSFLLPLKLSRMNDYMRSLKGLLPSLQWFREFTEIEDSAADESSVPEFVGQIVSCNTDGTLTIRMLGGDDERDIDIRHEQVLLTLDDGSVDSQLWTDDLLDEDPEYECESEEPEEEWTFKSLLIGLPDETYSESADPAKSIENSQTNISSETTLANEPGYEAGDFQLYPSPSSDDVISEAAIADTTVSSGVFPKQQFICSGDCTYDVEETSDQTEAEGNLSASASHEAEAGAAPSTQRNTVAIRHLIRTVCPSAFDILDEEPVHDHHFINEPQRLAATNRRLRHEYDILRTSLPSNTFVRTWESRMDLLRVLIFGPVDTPYEFAPFVFDIYLGKLFPEAPPMVRFHHWGIAEGDMNPNILDDGDICLSLLGTWDGARPSENWSSRSTLLQVLVSLSGLVLVKMPYFNEAGYEAYAYYGLRHPDAREYNEHVYLAAQDYIIYAAEHEIPGVDDVLAWYYMPDLDADSDGEDTQANSSRLPNYLHKAVTNLSRVIDHHNNTQSLRIYEGVNSASPFLDRMSVWGMADLHKRYWKLRDLEKSVVEDLNALRAAAG